MGEEESLDVIPGLSARVKATRELDERANCPVSTGSWCCVAGTAKFPHATSWPSTIGRIPPVMYLRKGWRHFLFWPDNGPCSSTVHLDHDKRQVRVGFGASARELRMKTLAIAVTVAMVLGVGSTLALMNNACKTSHYAWCAPAPEHHETTAHR
jgi:hypothetical protein